MSWPSQSLLFGGGHRARADRPASLRPRAAGAARPPAAAAGPGRDGHARVTLHALLLHAALARLSFAVASPRARLPRLSAQPDWHNPGLEGRGAPAAGRASLGCTSPRHARGTRPRHPEQSRRRAEIACAPPRPRPRLPFAGQPRSPPWSKTACRSSSPDRATWSACACPQAAACSPWAREPTASYSRASPRTPPVAA